MCSKEETMEAVRKSGNTAIKRKKSDRTASPAVSVVAKNDGEFFLFLCPLNKNSIQKVCFKTPDRCIGRTTEVSPVFLNMLTEAQRGIFRKNTVLGTVFLTDGDSDGCLIPLEKASDLPLLRDKELYFGVDRRSLAARLTGTRIHFEKALFIDVSESRMEAFFCIGEQVVSVFPIDVSKESFSSAEIVLSLISEPSEILNFSENFAPDILFISIPTPTEKDIKQISSVFNKNEEWKNTTLFFRPSDDEELALFAAKILADKQQKAMIK